VSLSKRSDHIQIRKKQLLAFGIIFNIFLLGYFKYADFFIHNVNYISNTNFPTLGLVLPLAISFFTFQQITYLVDSYKKETKEHDFLNYAVFVTFFPQLIAGPIVHHKEMMPQFANVRNKVKNYKNIVLGIFIFSIGLFKKVVIADTFALWATHGFDVANTLNIFEAWATSLSYTFQLYFDFSGYTDMAIGAALLFNIKLPINFNSPYKALNIQDFWKRWHITLSRFLRDYVYIPLGGNRKGKYRVYSNLLATFLIGGLWHGAGWTFIFWGFLHGVAMAVHRVWKELNFTVNKYLAWFVTFNFLNASWVFFRAKEWEDAIKVLKGMSGMNEINNISSLISFGGIAKETFLVMVIITMFSVYTFFAKNSNEMLLNFKYRQKDLVFSVALTVIAILQFSEISTFLYFNF
jgi:D-alanyl-lipoteichoic acid acyltransferase DltB (MBOAT superfamily)